MLTDINKSGRGKGSANGRSRCWNREGQRGLLTGAIIHKLAAGSHCGQGVSTVDDFLVQSIIREGVGSDVIKRLARGDVIAAQRLHVFELVV